MVVCVCSYARECKVALACGSSLCRHKECSQPTCTASPYHSSILSCSSLSQLDLVRWCVSTQRACDSKFESQTC